jgi:hypothetical protein
MEQATSIRFADYFFRAGIPADMNLLQGKLGDEQDQPSSDKKYKLSLPSIQQMEPHPLTNRYQPETLYRFPKEDHGPQDKFPIYTPMVCFIHYSFASQTT